MSIQKFYLCARKSTDGNDYQIMRIKVRIFKLRERSHREGGGGLSKR